MREKHNGQYLTLNEYARERVKYFQQEKRNFIFPSDRVMFFYYINTKITPNNFTFDTKDAIYYVTIAIVIFSQVKIIFTWEDIMFFMVWYFIVVYMYMTKEDISGLTLWKRCVKSFLESHLEGLAAREILPFQG